VSLFLLAIYVVNIYIKFGRKYSKILTKMHVEGIIDDSFLVKKQSD